MTPLTIETKRCFDVDTHVITGFTDEELSRLRGDKYPEDELVRMLDERNHGTGSCWACGYGIYGVFVREKDVCVTTGISCD